MTRASLLIRTLALLFVPASFLTSALAQSSAPVAYVYVVDTAHGSSTNRIDAFTAAPNGKLTPVAGSPFTEDVTNMAVNGKYLFASTRNGIYVDQFAIESGGGLGFVRSTNVLQYNPDDCGSSGVLVFDHTGTSLYDLEDRGDCANNIMHSFNVERPSGQLQDLGPSTGGGRYLSGLISFTGNNEFAYTTICVPGFGYQNFGFVRTLFGAFDGITATFPVPAAQPGSAYCPNFDAADRTNHLAITMQPAVSPADPYTFTPTGPPQIATFTVDAIGNLSTTSTYTNMPSTAVDTVVTIDMAPSGAILAVGGTKGLQLFHFNGASPVTQYTGLLVHDEVQQIFWDNADHVYALGLNKLWVFTATPTSVSQAPGSPYAIDTGVSLIVQPKTPKPAIVH